MAGSSPDRADAPGPAGSPTPDEPERIARALSAAEDELYRRVLGRVVRTLAIGAALAVAAVALVGWLSWTRLRRVLVEEAMSTLQMDDSLRTDVLAGLGIDTTGYARLLDLLSHAGTPGAVGAATDPDLLELERLLQSLLGERATGGARPVPRH